MTFAEYWYCTINALYLLLNTKPIKLQHFIYREKLSICHRIFPNIYRNKLSIKCRNFIGFVGS